MDPFAPTPGQGRNNGLGTNGEPSPEELVRFEVLEELGVSGLRRYGRGRAYIEDEWLPPLNAGLRTRMALFREVKDNDPIANTALRAIELALVRTVWRVDPFNDTAKHRETAEFVEECMFADMADTWGETIGAILSMLWAGFSVLETVYKRRKGDNLNERLASRFDDGKIGWGAWSPRSQDTLLGWVYDDHNNVIGVRQQAAPTWQEVIIPERKYLHFRNGNSIENPEGTSMLRGAWVPYQYLKRLREIEAIGAERDLAGLPKAEVPEDILLPTASPEQKAMRRAIEQLVQNIRQDSKAGLVWPRSFDSKGNQLYSLELMASGGTRQFPIRDLITSYEAHIARTLLADFLLLGTNGGGSGSFALSHDKTSLWMMLVDAIADSIEGVVNRTAIPRLLRLNGIDPSESPELVASPVRRANVAELGALLTSLATAGAPPFPNDVLEDYIYEAAEFPAITDQVREDRDAAAAAQQAMFGQMMPAGPGGDAEPTDEQPTAEPQPEVERERPEAEDDAGPADERLPRPPTSGR